MLFLFVFEDFSFYFQLQVVCPKAKCPTLHITWVAFPTVGSFYILKLIRAQPAVSPSLLFIVLLPSPPPSVCFTLTQDFPETSEADFSLFYVFALLQFQTVSALEPKR